MTSDELKAEYISRYEEILDPLARRLVAQLESHLSGVPRIDRISARPKNPARFLAKAEKTLDDGSPKYTAPFEQIQDLVGARIVVFYLQDVEEVARTIERYYFPVERTNLIPEAENAFGYVGKHYILSLPEDLFDDEADRDRSPTFFELQIKTLFQHAWSEAGHDLAYKPSQNLTSLQNRQIAFTAAQAWGADQIFGELHCGMGGAALPTG